MAYCRFSNSDIYLYENFNNEIICCMCSLVTSDDNIEESEHNNGAFDAVDKIMFTKEEALAHVREHIENGDYVPSHVISTLMQEINEENS